MKKYLIIKDTDALAIAITNEMHLTVGPILERLGDEGVLKGNTYHLTQSVAAYLDWQIRKRSNLPVNTGITAEESLETFLLTTGATLKRAEVENE